MLHEKLFPGKYISARTGSAGVRGRDDQTFENLDNTIGVSGNTIGVRKDKDCAFPAITHQVLYYLFLRDGIQIRGWLIEYYQGSFFQKNSDERQPL